MIQAKPQVTSSQEQNTCTLPCEGGEQNPYTHVQIQHLNLEYITANEYA
jgi:hypothetical protein